MLESFLITSRETLEASLVVGITLAYLDRTANQQYRKTVFWAIITAVLASIGAAFLFSLLADGFSGATEAIFEGTTMLIGAVLLTTMILWMLKQRQIAKHLEANVAKHLTKTQLFSHLGIFSLIFIAILREGVETVIFLNAAAYAGGVSMWAGAAGIIAAGLVGYLFFLSTHTINLKKLFTVSSVLLLLFAAGLVGHGVHEFEEAAVLNPIIYPLYNINHVLDENSVLGGFFKGLFGYNSNPSLLEVLAYAAYLVPMAIVFTRSQNLPRRS